MQPNPPSFDVLFRNQQGEYLQAENGLADLDALSLDELGQYAAQGYTLNLVQLFPDRVEFPLIGVCPEIPAEFNWAKSMVAGDLQYCAGQVLVNGQYVPMSDVAQAPQPRSFVRARYGYYDGARLWVF